MSADSETQTGEKSKRAGIAMVWIIEQLQKLWGNKLALLLAAYLAGNGSGTIITKIMGGAEPTTEADSTLIYVRELRQDSKEMKPVPRMVKELYIAFGKIKGGGKALEEAQFDEFKRKQREEKRAMGLSAPRAEAELPAQPENYVSRRQPRSQP